MRARGSNVFSLLLVLTCAAAPVPAAACVGDCNGNLFVAVNELVLGINVALGNLDAGVCRRFDEDRDRSVGIGELVEGVRNSADGCPAPVAGPELGSLVSGTAAYVQGTFVWTDYAYDDRGANLDAANGGDRTSSEFAGGDVAYPPEAAPGNVADLIQLQIGLDDGALSVRAILETLVDPALPVLGIAFDTDADRDTGAAALPGGAWTPDGPLGVELLAVLALDGGELWRFADGAWSMAETFDVTVDPERNVLEASLPEDDVEPQRDTWRVFAALGIATAAGNWLEGEAPIFDLAFVGNEFLVRWQENRQADVLAGVLDSAEAAALIDFARVADGADERPALAPGFHTFLYHSTLRLPEGIAFRLNTETEPGLNPIFLGPYQPYAIFIPEELPRPAPVAIFLHGLDQNHLGSVFVGDGTYLGTARAMSEDPYLVTQFAPEGFDFAPPTLQVLPLGRGEGLFYMGIAHQDVLDVTDDVMRRIEIDPDRVALQGGSMGGIGTFRIAALAPDRWSAAMPVIGFQTPDLLPLTRNLLNLPVRQINGGVDPLIPFAAADASAARLDELGYDYRYWLAFERGHEGSGALYECVFEEVGQLVRNRNPARVLFSVDPAFAVVDPAVGLDLRFDAAYWVSAIRVRDEEGEGTVDATSLALPRFEQTPVRREVFRDNLQQGADLCGPNPDVRTDDTWRERAIEIALGAALTVENRLEATLTNVAAVTFDVARAGLAVTDHGTIEVVSDGPVDVTFEGFAPGQPLLRDELPPVVADGLGNAVVSLEAGRQEIGF